MNPTLPIQINGASPAPAQAQNRAAGPSADAGQFSQTFSQAAQRQAAPRPAAPAPAPAPAKPAAQPQANANAKPNSANADKAPAQASQQADSSQPADSAATPAAPASADARPADAAQDAAAQEAAAQAAANAPVLDMLALVAGLTPAAAAPTGSAAVAAEDVALGRASAFPAGQEPVQADAAMRMLAADPKATAAQPGIPAFAGAATLPAQLPADAPGAAPALAVDAGAVADDTARLPVLDVAPATVDTKGLTTQAADAGQTPASAAGAAKAADAGAALFPAAGARDNAKAAAQEQFMIREIAQPQAQPAAAPLQQVSLAQAVANAAGDKLSARVGTPAWDNQVGQKIVWMVGGGEQSASLTLNPPDLGPMQVVLSVTNDHADVTFSAPQLEVRQALEDALPRLREMMSENGLSLGNASVNAGMPDNRQAQANGGGAAGQGGRSGNGGGQEGGQPDHGSAAAAEAQAAARAQRTGAVRSMVDTFV